MENAAFIHGRIPRADTLSVFLSFFYFISFHFILV